MNKTREKTIEYVKRYSNGETMQEIAESENVSKQAISQQILRALNRTEKEPKKKKQLVERVAKLEQAVNKQAELINSLPNAEEVNRAINILKQKHSALNGYNQVICTIENIFCYRVDGTGYWFEFNYKSTPNTKDKYMVSVYDKLNA